MEPPPSQIVALNGTTASDIMRIEELWQRGIVLATNLETDRDADTKYRRAGQVLFLVRNHMAEDPTIQSLNNVNYYTAIILGAVWWELGGRERAVDNAYPNIAIAKLLAEMWELMGGDERAATDLGRMLRYMGFETTITNRIHSMNRIAADIAADMVARTQMSSELKTVIEKAYEMEDWGERGVGSDPEKKHSNVCTEWIRWIFCE